ncbi:hypothetical protein [Sphaerisporangium rhizosphaerae]|uniref:Uncharacterized protein n=1 Tax=Sphaerisporangium rhizosphaerae TaxID=2269375 RepID=A0ABW2P4P9_9ACTN
MSSPTPRPGTIIPSALTASSLPAPATGVPARPVTDTTPATGFGAPLSVNPLPRSGVAALFGRARAAARASWDEAPGYRRLAYVTGAILIAIGLGHAVLWAVMGGTASGPLSWRKPVTFGVSFGMTTATLGAVAAHLPVRRWIGWVLSVLLCSSAAGEVAYISMQHARGVASHFNETTPLDKALFQAAGWVIGGMVLVIVVMAVASFVRTTAPAPMAWALRAGLVGLVTALAAGAWMIMHGDALVDAGATPLTVSMTTYGAAGAMKSAHAVPMHAVQVLGVIAWLLGLGGLPRRRQVWLVAMAIAGYAGLFTVLVLRTVAGLPPFGLDASAAAYLIPAGLLAGAGITALSHASRAMAADAARS